MCRLLAILNCSLRDSVPEFTNANGLRVLLMAVVVLDTRELKITRVSGSVLCSTLTHVSMANYTTRVRGVYCML